MVKWGTQIDAIDRTQHKLQGKVQTDGGRLMKNGVTVKMVSKCRNLRRVLNTARVNEGELTKQMDTTPDL